MARPTYARANLVRLGQNSVINCGSAAALIAPFTNGTSFTVEGWMFFDDIDSIHRVLASCQSALALHTSMVIMRRNNVIVFSFFSDDLTGKQVLLSNHWYHIACTFDAPTRQRVIYVNGVADNSDVSAGVLAVAAGSSFLIGSWGVRYHVGLTGDVRLWDHARSQSQIASLMHAKLTGTEAGLLGYWPFDEGQGTTVYDLGPNAAHGTMTNTTWTQTVRTPSVIGSSTVVVPPGNGPNSSPFTTFADEAAPTLTNDAHLRFFRVESATYLLRFVRWGAGLTPANDLGWFNYVGGQRERPGGNGNPGGKDGQFVEFYVKNASDPTGNMLFSSGVAGGGYLGFDMFENTPIDTTESSYNFPDYLSQSKATNFQWQLNPSGSRAPYYSAGRAIVAGEFDMDFGPENPTGFTGDPSPLAMLHYKRTYTFFNHGLLLLTVERTVTRDGYALQEGQRFDLNTRRMSFTYNGVTYNWGRHDSNDNESVTWVSDGYNRTTGAALGSEYTRTDVLATTSNFNTVAHGQTGRTDTWTGFFLPDPNGNDCDVALMEQPDPDPTTGTFQGMYASGHRKWARAVGQHANSYKPPGRTAENYQQYIETALFNSSFFNGAQQVSMTYFTNMWSESTTHNISAMSFSGTTATITTTTNHNCIVGTFVKIAGATLANGSSVINASSGFQVTAVPSATQFQITFSGTVSGYTPNTGSVTVWYINRPGWLAAASVGTVRTRHLCFIGKGRVTTSSDYLALWYYYARDLNSTEQRPAGLVNCTVATQAWNAQDGLYHVTANNSITSMTFTTTRKASHPGGRSLNYGRVIVVDNLIGANFCTIAAPPGSTTNLTGFKWYKDDTLGVVTCILDFVEPATPEVYTITISK